MYCPLFISKMLCRVKEPLSNCYPAARVHNQGINIRTRMTCQIREDNCLRFSGIIVTLVVSAVSVYFELQHTYYNIPVIPCLLG